MCVCASVQVAPILRIPPRRPCVLSGASLTTRTRRLHAVSTWRGTRNGTSLPYVRKKASSLSHSDGKPRVQLSSHATRAQSGLCRPIWVSLRACQLHIHWAKHTGCTRPAGSSRRASGKPPPMACVRALPWYSCDLIEVTAPSGFRLPLVAGIWVYPACLPTLERRDVRGRPR
jgi:hypothetical protein